MKKFSILLAVGFALFYAAFLAGEVMANYQIDQQVNDLLSKGEYVPGEILIKYKPGYDIEGAQLGALNPNGKKPMQDNIDKAIVPANQMHSTIAQLLRRDKIETVQPNYIYRLTSWNDTGDETVPNDFNASNHWYYDQADLPAMWKKLDCPGGEDCGGSNEVIVAVIDTGLAAFDYDDTGGVTGSNFVASSEYENINLFENSLELADPGNNMDDDCNGFVDDYHGVDTYATDWFPNNTNITCPGGIPAEMPDSYAKAGMPTDTYGHGTFVTGLVSSIVDNGAGSVSPAFNVRIMPIAANFHFVGSFSTADIRTGIDYAINNGADVINMSLGGPSYDPLFDQKVQDAIAADIVVVVSSGNTGQNVDACPPSSPCDQYPAGFSNVITVGSVNSNDTRSGYTTYGAQLEVSAYVGSGGSAGNAAYQTTLACMSSCNVNTVDDGFVQRYGIGTSYASPQVAALAALIKSFDNTYDREDIEQIIFESAVDIDTAGKDNRTGHGVINFERAFDLVEFYNAAEIPDTQTIYRFYNQATQTHFYTNSESEKNKVINNYPQFQFEGSKYKVIPDSYATDVVPVYRFYNRTTATHFYTAKESEKNKVVNNLPQFDFEGSKFFVYNENRIKSKPIYRFYNTNTNTHLYVDSESEKNKVVNNFPQFQLEGVAYYVPDF